MLSDFLTGIRLVLRARIPGVSGLFLLVLALAVILAAQFSGRQPATVALNVGLSLMRLLLPLILVLMVQELFSREFDRRYFLSSLAYPRSRYSFFLGRFGAIFVLLLGLLVVMAILLVLLVLQIGHGYMQGTPVGLGAHYILTIVFLGVDLLLLAALACLLAVVASTPSFVLIGTLGFMVLARSFSAVMALLAHDTTVVGNIEHYRAGVGVLSYLLPDLGALDVRMITLYGNMGFLPSDWLLLLLSSLAYVAALLALAVWALQCKRFA